MNELAIFSWNVRGVNNSTTRKGIKDLVIANKANFICLQETKCSKWNSFMISSLWGLDGNGWVEVDSRGLSGGLVCSWDVERFKVLNVHKDQNWIGCRVQSIGDSKCFNIINVYAPQDQIFKRYLWHTLEIYLA